MVAIPVLVLPFLAMLFWAGGGARGQGGAMVKEEKKGLNMILPSATPKDEGVMDKLALYNKAERDSLDLRGKLEADPYYQQQFAQQKSGLTFQPAPASGNGNPYTYAGPGYNDPSEAKVYERLNLLNATLNQPQKETGPAASNTVGVPGAGVSAADIDRLQGMMEQMQQNTGDDEESKQLNGMLERILDIQHPERVKERLRKSSAENKGRVFPVSGVGNSQPSSVLDSQHSVSNRKAIPGFFGEETLDAAEQGNAIEAVVHETQVLTNGSVVKLRLTSDVYVNGILIPKGQFVFGTAALSGERLTVQIENIRFASSLYPVQLVVFDIDGLEGIHVPGAIGRDVAKESGDRGLQGIGMTSLEPSIGAQAVTAGIEATRSLISKKIKLIRVTVKAGYRVLLKDSNSREY